MICPPSHLISFMLAIESWWYEEFRCIGRCLITKEWTRWTQTSTILAFWFHLLGLYALNIGCSTLLAFHRALWKRNSIRDNKVVVTLIPYSILTGTSILIMSLFRWPPVVGHIQWSFTRFGTIAFICASCPAWWKRPNIRFKTVLFAIFLLFRLFGHFFGHLVSIYSVLWNLSIGPSRLISK